MSRVYNFAPGPAMLPTPVMERARAEFMDWQGLGASVIEVSHRSRAFEALVEETDQLLRELMGIPDNYRICYMHGGGQMQFSAVPLNLLGRSPENRALYIDTGNFAARAIAEARHYGEIEVVASSEQHGHDRIPELDLTASDPAAAYLHITTNNTLEGTRWQSFPETADLPLVGDATSEILSREIDVSRFGLIYAGAQKNLGPAGLAVVIVREDLLEYAHPLTPNLLKYSTLARDHSLTNTPNTFAIYMVRLVLEWLRDEGGVAAIEQVNEEKARLLYERIDRTGFYRAFVRAADRSTMNAVFDVPTAQLSQTFVAEAEREGLTALKGHRAIGGLRASIYNAMPLEGVQALVQFMDQFEAHHG